MSFDRNKVRRQICRVLPKDGGSFTVFNQGRLREIDEFYLLCQKHRDYYRDHSGQLHKLPYFDVCVKRYPNLPRPTEDYVRQCPRYHRHPYAVTCPCPEQRYRMGSPPNLKIDICGKRDRYH